MQLEKDEYAFLPKPSCLSPFGSPLSWSQLSFFYGICWAWKEHVRLLQMPYYRKFGCEKTIAFCDFGYQDLVSILKSKIFTLRCSKSHSWAKNLSEPYQNNESCTIDQSLPERQVSASASRSVSTNAQYYTPHPNLNPCNHAGAK